MATCRKLFVVGTGTDVGKTYVSALIVKKMTSAGARIGYFKAATSGYGYDASGRAISGEALFVKEFSGLTQEVETACPFNYARAVSPHLAARLESKPYDQGVVDRAFEAVCSQFDYVVIEGSGGLFCPLRMEGEDRILILDLIERWKAPCLVVSDSGLGSINDATLTLLTLATYGAPTVGVAFNRYDAGDVMRVDNVEVVKTLTSAPVVARIPEGARTLDLDVEIVRSWFGERCERGEFVVESSSLLARS